MNARSTFSTGNRWRLTLPQTFFAVLLTVTLSTLAVSQQDSVKPNPLRPEQQKQEQEQAPKPTYVPKAKLQPFFETYCYQCHGPDLQEADIRFDKTRWRIVDNDSAQRWQDVLDQLNGGDMPPEGEEQPTEDELADALGRLTNSLVVARRRLTDHGGEIKLRRLNRREYNNTIKHLFGFEIPPELIPDDGEFSRFDTVGSEQLFNSSHFEKYLELGEKIGEEAFRWNTKKHASTTIRRDEPETVVNGPLREKLADLDRKMEMKKQGKTWQEMGFKDEGQAEIIFSQFDRRAGNPRRYLQYPLVDQGAYLSDSVKWVNAHLHTDIRGEYIIRVRGGALDGVDDIRKIVRVSDRYGLKGTLQIQGTTENPQSVELRTRQKMGQVLLSAKIDENMPQFTDVTSLHYLKKLQGSENAFDPWAAVWIDWVEIEGPFYPEQRPWLEEFMYPGVPTGTRKNRYFRKNQHAKEFIESFAFEAFRRRKPAPAFIDALHKRFMDKRDAGGGYIESMSEIMGIILSSPAFLYLHEDIDPGTRALDNRELAVRLSYFLWSGPPDEELYNADLSDAKVMEGQVNRMLGDPKSEAFLNGFVDQWAEFNRFDAITVDEKKHFRFNSGLRDSAKREVRKFFEVLIDENLSAANLIDSDFVVINPTLATHYNIPGITSSTDAFQKVTLPKDSPRGGLMTQTAFLVAGSNGERSSPVIRGALVMEKLLHDEPAPPPPNVPELGGASKKPRTNREMVKMHQKQAVCASCHRKMDVIGFGLENFDTVGAWRDKEKVGRKKVAIDSTGVLPDGQTFADVNELKQVLMANNEDNLVRELTESILAYGLGRTVEFSDADDVDELVKKIGKDGNRVRAIIREVALSKLFQRK